MKFEKLTQKVLNELYLSGFNILQGNNAQNEENISWFPEKVDDVWEYLIEMELKGELSDDPHILVIEDAVNNIDEEQLYGYVLKQ